LPLLPRSLGRPLLFQVNCPKPQLLNPKSYILNHRPSPGWQQLFATIRLSFDRNDSPIIQTVCCSVVYRLILTFDFSYQFCSWSFEQEDELPKKMSDLYQNSKIREQSAPLLFRQPRHQNQSIAACCSVLQCVCCSVVCCKCFSFNRNESPQIDSKIVGSMGSELQCVAVCCSVLQRVAACCSVLQRVAACCSVLQCVAVCCSVLQRVAVYCSMLQCVAVCCSVCSVLQRVAACCSVLQCVAVYCSV